jgi:DNA-binding beta-propeller fold protein YncE
VGAALGVILMSGVAIWWRARGESGAACSGPGCVSTLVGSGQAGFVDGPAASARLDTPYGVAFGRRGALYVADGRNHRVRRVEGGNVTTLAGDGERGLRDCAPGPCDATAVRLSFPTGVAVLSSGEAPDRELLLVADGDNAVIRWILVREPCPVGTRACVLASGTLAGMARLPGFADGEGARARFDNPKSVAASPLGALFVADHGNHRIRRIDATLGPDLRPLTVRVSTLAGDGVPGFRNGASEHARMRGPRAVEWLGDAVYFTDGDNHLVRVVRSGRVETVAGLCATDAEACPRGHADGTPAQARFDGPRGLAVAPSGDLYVSELGNHDVRLVSPARGVVRTLAGQGAAHAGLHDGAPLEALFYSPHGLALTPARDLVVADLGNNALRQIAKVTEIIR